MSHQSTGALVDLSLVHTLFQTDADDYGHVRNDVKYTVYPLAFTRNMGNVQADGVISPFARRMNIIDKRLRGREDGVEEEERQRVPHGRQRRRRRAEARERWQPRDGRGERAVHSHGENNSDGAENERSGSDDDAMNVDAPIREHHAGLPALVHAICSQIYNAISHRLRDAAKFHEVQLGLVTAALAGATAASLPSQHKWERNRDRCRGDLPHVRCAQKIAGGGQPQCMRFENTYRVDVGQLAEQKRHGECVISLFFHCGWTSDMRDCTSVIFDELIAPLAKSWTHPSVISAIKRCCVVLRQDVCCYADARMNGADLLCFCLQVVPELFQCTSYPITCLMEYLWKKHEPNLRQGYVVDPFELETMAMLERVLNYAHTGSARVLTRTLMDRAWLSLSVVNDGLPCISKSFIQAGSLSSGLITIRREKWPIHPASLSPLTASQRTQELTYGKPHFSVSQ